MKIAKKRYHKNANLKPHYFKDYSESVRRLPFWYNTVAIDLLMQHNLNPISKISASKIAESWVRLRKDKMTFEQAYTQFKKEFKPQPEDDDLIIKVIKSEYENKVSTADA